MWRWCEATIRCGDGVRQQSGQSRAGPKTSCRKEESHLHSHLHSHLQASRQFQRQQGSLLIFSQVLRLCAGNDVCWKPKHSPSSACHWHLSSTTPWSRCLGHLLFLCLHVLKEIPTCCLLAWQATLNNLLTSSLECMHACAGAERCCGGRLRS